MEGSTNDPSNIARVTIEEHAELHRQLWKDLGHWQDKIAWQCLSGQITMSEASQMAIRQGQLNAAEKNRGRKWTEEECEKLRGPRGPYKKRKPMPPRPDHVKEKIAKSMKGVTHPPERNEANSLGQKKRFKDPLEYEKVIKLLDYARMKRWNKGDI
tara:strand:+ start:75 stop:542 length:468 start_codon:yes stop_codon:yes gene_type:complete